MSQRRPDWHPHDEHLIRSWERCRWALNEVRSDPKKRDIVLRWIDEKLAAAKFPFLPQWRRVVLGEEPALIAELAETKDFFDLPEARRDEWGRLVQSHPFAPLLARRASA